MGRPERRVVAVDPTDRDPIARALKGLRGAAGLVYLPPGAYEVGEPIVLPSHVALVGAGSRLTTITLVAGSDCHVLRNADHELGNEAIELRGLAIEGTMDGQDKPADLKGLTYACGAYLKRVRGVVVSDVIAHGIRQTAVHLVECADVDIDRVEVDQVGWSGISSCATDDLRVGRTTVTRSGLDVLHSGLHIDGGRGARLEVVVDDSTGNGVMLDSTYAPLSDVVVRAVARRCLRGIALSGDHENPLTNVFVSGDYSENRECGVFVSNASAVFVVDATIGANGQAGIVLQGTSGARHVVVSDCRITGSPAVVQERDGNRVAYLTATTTIRADGARAGADGPAAGIVPDDDAYEGTCNVCGEPQVFVRRNASLREGYRCEHCKALLRYRGQADVLLRAYARHGAMSIAALAEEPEFAALAYWEPGVLGPFRAFLDARPNTTRSDFLPGVPPGETRDGIRCEDLMALTFPAESFDVIVTSDIFEHVRHPAAAFAEIHRVLRPGGRHVFSIPVQHPLRSVTVPRVDVTGDEDVFLLEPRYHSGPGGSRHLVYNDFGADLVEALEPIGFDTDIVRFESPNAEAARLLTFCSVKR